MPTWEPRDRRRPPEDAAHRAEDRRFERRYQIEEKPVGEGTYGAVYMAKCRDTKQTVAVKKVKMDSEEEGIPSTAIREVAVLKGANHPNIVKLLDVCCTPGRLHLVFEFIEVNLKQHLKRNSCSLLPTAVRELNRQLLRGVEFCHSHRIIHRDLKPQNILIESTGRAPGNELLKIADFGMARAFSLPVPKYTHEVVTTWYRAPEILLGTQEYSMPVDVWSAGCILAEVATGAALFQGDSEIDTIFQIFKKLGTPTEVEWPDLAKLPDFKPTFPRWKKTPWQEIRNIGAQMGPAGIDVLERIFAYEPRGRDSARQALAQPYFADMPPTIGILAQGLSNPGAVVGEGFGGLRHA